MFFILFEIWIIDIWLYLSSSSWLQYYDLKSLHSVTAPAIRDLTEYFKYYVFNLNWKRFFTKVTFKNNKRISKFGWRWTHHLYHNHTTDYVFTLLLQLPSTKIRLLSYIYIVCILLRHYNIGSFTLSYILYKTWKLKSSNIFSVKNSQFLIKLLKFVILLHYHIKSVYYLFAQLENNSL